MSALLSFAHKSNNRTNNKQHLSVCLQHQEQNLHKSKKGTLLSGDSLKVETHVRESEAELCWFRVLPIISMFLSSPDRYIKRMKLFIFTFSLALLSGVTASYLDVKRGLRHTSLVNNDEDGRELSETERAVTVWWVIFHNPWKCAEGPGTCGEADFFTPAVKTSVFYATSGITDSSGEICLAGSTYKTNGKSNLLPQPDPNDISPLSRGAWGITFLGGDPEILMVVRDHGPKSANEDEYLAQILNFNEPLCSNQGGPNDCNDVQFVKFLQGEEGKKNLLNFPGFPEPPEDAFAFLNRQGDALQIVIKTNIAQTS